MELRVPDTISAVRLERYLKERLPEFPRSGFFAALRKGKIRVNGSRVTDAGLSLSPGDRIEIAGYLSHPRVGAARADRQPRTYSIIFEDEAILVVDKASGTAVHPGARTGGTLIDELEAYARSRHFAPYLVHRLDRHTSGLMIIAKSREVASALGEALRGRGKARVHKRYVALVFGAPTAEGRIEAPLDGRPALSTYRTRERLAWNGELLALLEVQIETGRKHQIRRHLAGVGFPVVGDAVYGDWKRNRVIGAALGIEGPLLHADTLELAHPVSGVTRRFNAPLPERFALLLASLDHVGGARKERSKDEEGPAKDSKNE